MQKNSIKQLLPISAKVAFIVLTVGLVGCEDRVALADKKMLDIRNQPAQPIKPPPSPEKVEEFSYSAGNLRSPFMPTSLMLQATQEQKIQGVKLDTTRLKEPLEQFELNQLVYKGSLVSQSGELYGLVQTPDGQIATVKVGNHIGKNDGRIAEITPTQINLIEIVPDSRVGYVEKPATLAAAVS